MLDDNWELINGAAAHHIEQLNAINTINVIEALVTFLSTHRPPTAAFPYFPNEVALKELHRAGTLFLLSDPGAYRTEPVHVSELATGRVIYQPPAWEAVPEEMQNFFAGLQKIWATGDALDAAAFALWRINWVHPFRNGNGRTARAFAYACLCARLDVWLPGSPTVIDQIMATRPDYERALRAADASAQGGQLDLSEMKYYLHVLLTNQIQSIGAGP